LLDARHRHNFDGHVDRPPHVSPGVGLDFAPTKNVTEVLEIGAGIGVVGLAGLSLGLNVTISDYEPKSVELALFNACRNGFRHGKGLILDWRSPPELQYQFLWGCDLLYEDRNHEPLLNLTKKVLTPNGIAWFGDPGRARAKRFCQSASAFGLDYELFDENRNRLADPRVGQYQLIEIRHCD
jgi:predicted nicotinamide N-methyase